jgi:hypothetical protein
MKKIVFFNYYHNGDIHVSRGFIRHIIARVHQIDPSIQFSYAHRNASELLSDIPNLGYEPSGLSVVNNDHAGIVPVGDTIYINTWYARQHYRYMSRYGITIDSLYVIFDDVCKSLWGFSLEDISKNPADFFPIIDYSKFKVENAKTWLDKYPGKKVFVSNGQALSDQAYYFALTPIIDQLSKKHPDKIFILSNHDGHPGSQNIIHTSDIIQKQGNDLNENSYIASHCDVIIGKASGAFTFAVTQETCFQKRIKFLAFCNLLPKYPNKFWLSERLKDQINYTSEFIVSNEPNVSNVTNIIDTNL